MWIYDLDTLRFLAVNKAAISKYGYSREEFLAMTIADIRPEEDRDALGANVAAVTEGRDEAGVWRHRLKSGDVIYVDITGHTIDHDGKRAELIAARDVSRFVIAEQIASDVAAREQAARQKSDMLARQFQKMFDNVPGMYLVFCAENHDVVAVSDGYLDTLNLTRNDVVGHNLFETLPPQPDDMTHSKMRESFDRVLSTCEPDLLDVQKFLLPGDEERYCGISCTPVTGSNERLLHLILRIQDLTDGMRADGVTITALDPAKIDILAHTRDLKSDNIRLSKLAARLRSTQRLLGTGTWDYLIDKDRLDWSDSVYRMLGSNPDQFGNKADDYFALVHPDDRAALRASFEDFLASGDTYFSFAHRIRHPDGRLAHVHGEAEKTECSEGTMLRGVVQDVTASVEVENALRQANRMLEIAGTSAKFGAWRYDARTDVSEWSNQIARIHDEPDGFSPTLANLISYYVPEDRDRLLHLIFTCLEHGEAFDDVFQIITAKRRRVSVRATGEAERDETGRIVALRGSFQDVSDLTAAQRRAEEIGARLVETLENIGDGFFMLDRDRRFTYFNNQAEIILDRPGYALIGKNIFDEFPGFSDSGFEIQYARAVKTGETVRFEHFYSPLERMFSISAHPTPNGLAVYFRDITEEQRRDEQLRLLDAAVGQINDIVIITEAEDVDEAGQPRIVYVNNAFERITGYSREEAIGQTPRILEGPKTDRSYLDQIRQAFDTHAPFRPELINYTKSGAEYWLELDIVPLVDYEGSVTHFVAVQRDVTERRKAEEALRLSETRFRVIAQAAGNAVWEWDIANERLWWSDGMVDLFGHSPDPEETLFDVWRANVHPEDASRVLESIDGLLLGKTEALHDRYRFRRANGNWANVENHAFLIRDDEGRAIRILASMMDVSERLAMEDRLRHSQKLEAVGQLTGGLAHDFNNLLMIIMGNIELLQEELDDTHPLRKHADMSAMAADRAADLTKRLLAFSRKQALNSEVSDVNAAVGGIEGMIRRTLGEDISIEMILADSVLHAEIDASQLEASLLNLAINSRDSMPNGGILTIETSNASLDEDYVSTEHGLKAGPYVVIAVSDTGHGIPKDQIDHVFEPFFTTKGKGKGTGLGLSMVYGFVKQSGGHIQIYSETNEGTTVKLYFPKLSDNSSIPSREKESITVIRGEETILVVEDDKLILQQLIAQLTELGYEVVSASAGAPALAILRERSDIDLLFTDVILPGGMNGREIAEAAQAIRPDLKILYTSGYPENAIVHNGRLNPGVELLGKPYRRSELASKMRKVLDA
jgi:PAS domain S-box-containing protein